MSELKTVGAATRNAREPKIVFDLGTARRLFEGSEREGMYGVTDKLR